MKLALCLSLMIAAFAAPAVAADRTAFYVTQEMDRAEDCARACADDSLCVAWSFRDLGCGFSATAPQTIETGAEFGLSPHAPAFVRAQFAARQALQVADKPAPAPIIAEHHEDEASLLLLGGPEDDSLRPRLALRR